MAVPLAPVASTAYFALFRVVATRPWFCLPVARIAPPVPPTAPWLVTLAPNRFADPVWAARPTPDVLSMKAPVPEPRLFICSATPGAALLVLTVVLLVPASFAAPRMIGSPAAAATGPGRLICAPRSPATPPMAAARTARRER